MTDKTVFADWVDEHAVADASLDARIPLYDLKRTPGRDDDAWVTTTGDGAHHVREFYRLLRYLADGGFTGYAFKAPFTEAPTMDAWIRGGNGPAAKQQRKTAEVPADEVSDWYVHPEDILGAEVSEA